MDKTKTLSAIIPCLVLAGTLTTAFANEQKQSKTLQSPAKDVPSRQFLEGQDIVFSTAKTYTENDGYGEFTGELTTSDPRFQDGTHFDEFHWTGAPGERLSIRMNSDDFDTMLLVFNSDAEELERNDDGPTNSNSELEVSIPNNGQIAILANSFNEGATGSYTLSVQPVDNCSCNSASGGQNVISLGNAVRGNLGPDSEILSVDGTYVERWTFSGEAGQTIVINMMSDDFDAYLGLIGPSGEQIASDDDGGDGFDSRIQTTLPRDGNYQILANQVGTMNGAYSLLVELKQGVSFDTGGHPYEKYALIVGVSDYPGQNNDLPLVAEDVKAVKRMFVQNLGIKPENILILENGDATRENILTGITQYLGQAGESGSAIFYYSGHGTQTDGNVGIGPPIDNESDGMDEAIVAYDELVIDDEIAFALNEIGAGKVLVLFDSCYSGDATRGDGINGMPKLVDYNEISDHVSMPDDFFFSKDYSDAFMSAAIGGVDVSVDGRLFIAASAEDELSWVAPELGMSIFTYFLTEMMADAQPQTFAKFVDDVSYFVNQYAESNFEASQSSHLEGTSASGQIVIGEFFD